MKVLPLHCKWLDLHSATLRRTSPLNNEYNDSTIKWPTLRRTGRSYNKIEKLPWPRVTHPTRNHTTLPRIVQTIQWRGYPPYKERLSIMSQSHIMIRTSDCLQFLNSKTYWNNLKITAHNTNHEIHSDYDFLARPLVLFATIWPRTAVPQITQLYDLLAKMPWFSGLLPFLMNFSAACKERNS